MSEFANEARDDTANCDFSAEFFEDALITSFVMGVGNNSVRKYLLQQDLKVFEKTVSVARTIETEFG